MATQKSSAGESCEGCTDERGTANNKIEKEGGTGDSARGGSIVHNTMGTKKTIGAAGGGGGGGGKVSGKGGGGALQKGGQGLRVWGLDPVGGEKDLSQGRAGEGNLSSGG